MIARRSFHWTRWLVPAVAAGTAVSVEKFVGFEPPRWSYWISVALFTLFGVITLANRHSMPGTSPAFARITGAIFLILAALGAFYQLSSS